MKARYLTLLAENKLEARVDQLEALLRACTVCPKDCGNNRLNDELAACYSGRLPIVSSYTAHFGEEPVLSGTGGAGKADMGKRVAGEGLAPEHEEIADRAGNDADNGAGIEGVAHEFIVKDRGHAPRFPVRPRLPIVHRRP